MTAEKTAGQISWTARNMFLAGPGDQPGDVLAELDGTWDYLSPEEREAEEAGAQAVLAPARAMADAWNALARKCDEAAALPGLAKAGVLEQATFARQLRECAAALRTIAGESS